MDSIIHTGIRPQNPVEEIKENERFFYLEKATGKKWTKREMNSGCYEATDQNICISVKGQTLIYCPFCDEYFAAKQFEILEG